MKRTDKEQLVIELKEKIGGAQALYYTDFTGLNVKRMTELRRRLRKANVEYVVIKNTLALRAVNESGLVGERLKGPTGLVIGRDAVGAAKVLTDFQKDHEDRPAFKVGVLERKVIAPAQIVQLAKLPSREALLAQLAGALQAPMAALAGVLEAKIQEMAGLLDALKDQRGQA